MKLIIYNDSFVFIVAADKIIRLAHHFVDSSNLCIYSCSNAQNSDVIGIDISRCGKYLLACFSSKWISCWNIDSAELLGSKLCRKRVTSMIHSLYPQNSAQSMLVFSDKFGEIFAVDTPNMKHDPVLCGSHTTSTITSMIFRDNYLITCDRDEKIRVQTFPDMVNIVSYCLGHTSVVTSIEVLDSKYLVSISWDYRLIVWNYLEGVKLAEFKFIQDSSSDVANDKANTSHEVIEDDMEEGNDEDEEEKEKDYNENSAGNYPLKIIYLDGLISSSQTNAHYVAVTFKGGLQILFYRIEIPLDSSPTIEINASIQLSEVPCDITFNSKDKSLVALSGNGLKIWKCEVIDNKLTFSDVLVKYIEDLNKYYHDNSKYANINRDNFSCIFIFRYSTNTSLHCFIC